MINTRTRTLKEVYDETHEKNPIKLAELSGKSVSYVKSFLKKNVAELEVISDSKIDLSKVDYVPAGSYSNNHYQADITFLHDYKRLKDNKKHVGILTVLNTTTRKAYARPIKSTEGNGVMNAMKEIIEEARVNGTGIDILRTDNGSEFQSKFKDMLEEMGIHHEMAEAHTHNWMARTNRFHRTLKESIKRLFALNGKNIWLPHLQDLIDDYNKTPSFAFRNVESLKHEPKTLKGKPYYKPVAPNMVEKSGPKFLSKVHGHEVSKAEAVYNKDSEKLKVGDYVRLLNALTKEQILLNGKFAKKSLENSWSTKVYKILERTGPNFWRLDEPGNEITQWATYMLKKTTKEAYENQEQAVKTKAKEKKQIKVARAQAEEERNISKKEKKTTVSKTRGNKTITRAEPVSYTHLRAHET